MSTKLLKARKAKARDRSRKEILRVRALRDLSLQDRLSHRLLEQTDLNLSLNRKSRSRVADGFLFAMMSTKSKPTWRHATWNSSDYMVCTVIEPQKKLPVFKPGKWSILPRSRIALYGHDAKSMKNLSCILTLRISANTLTACGLEYVCQIQSSISHDCVLDPTELVLEPGQDEPDLCFS